MMTEIKTRIPKKRIWLWVFATILVCALLLTYSQGVLFSVRAESAVDMTAPISAAESEEEALDPIKNFNLVGILCYLIEDILLFDIDNLDPERVSLAHFFSGYDGQIVLIGDWANRRSGSFGRILGLHKSDQLAANLTWLSELLRHEHGHYEQFKQIGLLKFIITIAIPSLLNQPADYYSQPWEVTADILGGVTTHYHSPGSEQAGIDYLNAVNNANLFSILFGFWK